MLGAGGGLLWWWRGGYGNGLCGHCVSLGNAGLLSAAEPGGACDACIAPAGWGLFTMVLGSEMIGRCPRDSWPLCGTLMLGILALAGCDQGGGSGPLPVEDRTSKDDLKGLVEGYVRECQAIANMLGGYCDSDTIRAQKQACELAFNRIPGLQTDSRVCEVRQQGEMISLMIGLLVSAEDIEKNMFAKRDVKSADELSALMRLRDKGIENLVTKKRDTASDIRTRVAAIQRVIDRL